MSASEPAGAPAVDLTDLDIRQRALEAAEAVREARKSREYKTSGDGRYRDLEAEEQKRRDCKTVGQLAKTELSLLKFLAEHQHEERLEQIEAELGL